MTTTCGKSMPASPSGGTFLAILLCSMLLPHIPLLNILVGPMVSLDTIVHEMGHAVASIVTGGTVTGMTIVPDGQGHGGLTMSEGGIRWIVAQAGYLGTTLVGCALIALGRLPRLSKPVLFLCGLAFLAASFAFMAPVAVRGGSINVMFQGIASMLVGWCLAAGLIFMALKWDVRFANLALLFLGVQMGLNSLTDNFGLLLSTLGFGNGAWSDATNMQKMTGVPAFIWTVFWSAASVAMLWFTVKWTYKAPKGSTL